MTQVKIYKPTKNAMQSGLARTKEWVLEFITTAPKPVDSLMGWVGQSDTAEQLKLRFTTEQEAIAYAKKHGYQVQLLKPKTRKISPKSYADNFRFSKVR